MVNTPSQTAADALVIFGVTGDLAHKMIFPALYEMAKRGDLNVPVVGVAAPPWGLPQLRERATDSIERAGGIDDRDALEHLLTPLQYVGGDYNDPETFNGLRALNKMKRLTINLWPVEIHLVTPAFAGVQERMLFKKSLDSGAGRNDGFSPGCRSFC